MKRISIFLVSFVLCGATMAQSTAPAFVRDSLDKYAERALREWQVPGMAICIVKGDEVILKAYGVKEMGKADKIDENTLFMIASNSKAMTATALAILHEQKKLSLDDKVVKWLPDFKMKDAWVTKELNIRDLLSHRIGMETFQGDFMYWTSTLTDKQVIEKFGKLTPPYSFRSKWGYTNAAFVVAGEVIRAASGKSWGEYLTENIFRPLGMNNTVAYCRDFPTASNRATPHTMDHSRNLIAIQYANIDNLAAAGSVSSSVSDLSKWVMMLLKGGKHNDKQLFSPIAINHTRLPHSILGNASHPYNKMNFNLYGLGWALSDYNSKRIVSHTGGINGFLTSVTLIPEEKLGIVVLTNTDHNGLYQAIKSEILDAYLNLPYRNYANISLLKDKEQSNQEMEMWRKKADTVSMHKATSLPLSAYAGKYTHEVYGSLNIKAGQQALTITFEHHPNLKATLEPLGGDRFLCTYSDPAFGRKVLPFTTANGKVKSLTVLVADFVEFTPYEFIKN